jgi:hypothetical protein
VSPSGWSGCSATETNMPAVVAPPGPPEPVTIAKPANVTSDLGTGMSAVNHDPDADASSTYVSYGDENWETLKSMAIFPSLTPNPAPTVTNGTCDKTDLNNWGEPVRPNLATEPCYNYFPIIYIDGDLEVHGGRGQGIMLVNGNMKMNGGFKFYGLIIAKGNVEQGTGGTEIHGSIMTANNATIGWGEDETLNGNIKIQYSQCSIEHAMRGSAQVVQAKERSWTELY